MKHHSLLTLGAILLTGCLLLNSCSTSYEARRFSNLNYVKKDVSPAKDATSFTKEELAPLNNHETSSGIETPDNDYSASIQPKANTTKAEKIINEPKPSASASKLSPADVFPDQINKKELKKTFQTIKEQMKTDSKSDGASLIDEPNKLLILWIALAGAAIVFSIIGAYVPFVWIFATLAWIASVVFFVLWIVAIANS
jgi:hypothetical protein